MLQRHITLPCSGNIVSVRRVIRYIALFTRVPSWGTTYLYPQQGLHTEYARMAYHTRKICRRDVLRLQS